VNFKTNILKRILNNLQIDSTSLPLRRLIAQTWMCKPESSQSHKSRAWLAVPPNAQQQTRSFQFSPTRRGNPCSLSFSEMSQVCWSKGNL